MQQNIKYTGLAATPSDYECPDGQLAVALGLVSEDGSLKAVPQPRVVGASLGSRRVLFLHATASYRHYIVASADSTRLYWIAEEYLVGDFTPQQAEQHLVEITHTIGSVLTVNAVGNTLAVMTDGGLYYFLWKNNAYKNLGQKPPEMDVRFGTSELHAELYHGSHKTYAHSVTFQFGETNYVDYFKQLLNHCHSIITKNNRFYAPFIVRYCYRLFDGSMFMHSAPVFMPLSAPYNIQATYFRFVYNNNTHRPYYIPHDHTTGDSPYDMYYITENGGWEEIEVYPGFTYGFTYQPVDVSLMYTPYCWELEKLKDEWGDVVKSVDIFVSRPLIRERLDDFSIDYHANNISNLKPPIYHFVNSKLDIKPEKYRANTYHWHYSYDYVDEVVIALKGEDEYLDEIKNESVFRKIASIPIGDIVNGEQREVPIQENVLSTLAAQEAMSDDYRTHNTFAPSFNEQGVSRASLFAYNNRLNVSGVNDRLFEGFHLWSMLPDFRNDVSGWTAKQIVVYIDTDDGEKIVSRDVDYRLWLPAIAKLPLYYPDNRAKKMMIKAVFNEMPSSFDWFKFDMAECPMINGAYTKGGVIVSTTNSDNWPDTAESDEYPPDPLPDGSDIVNTGNKVYTSEVDNPFLFPATAINSVGTGEILALCTTTKALSQGQFGQFPLYAFTTDGVWALSVASDGTYSSMHAVSRDVCTNPYSITQIDSAVLFVTDRGIMLLQGSDTVCISDGILADNPFDPSSLPHLSTLHSCHAAAMSHAFLAACRMVYDYRNQHIVVFNPAVGDDDSQPLYPYAFVYNLKSHLWGMMHSTLASPVNSYPEAMAIDRDGHLVSFDADGDATPVDGLLVTRPLKLGNADGLKTIHTLLQRGVFQRGDVKTVLYGSRDLYSWHLVASSVDHSLRGLRGTPYKYFRIAALVSLDPGESLSGATLDFEPRHTARLH